MTHAGHIIHGAREPSELVLDADVVVVGSGAGGATVARALALAGERVVVLEEGPHVTAAEHAQMRPSQSLRNVWRDGGSTFAVGLGDSPVINVTMGRVVGGSSFITGGVCLRTPDEVLERWVRERGLHDLGPKQMAPYFDAVEKMLGVQTVPEALRSRGVVRFGEGHAKAHGGRLESLQRNTDGCVGEGQCNFGCPHQAKRSVDLACLPDALHAGTTIVADARVDRLTFDRATGRRIVGVSGRLLGPARRNFVVHARRTVLAAGAWHDPLLLMRHGIGKRDGHVGHHLTVHPSFRVCARFDEPIRGWEGSLQSAYSPHFMHDGLTLVALFVPFGILPATMPGIGPALSARAKHIPNIALFGGLIHDEGGGTVRPGLGREPVVTYRMAAEDRAKIPVLFRRMAEVYFAAGAREVYLPILGSDPVLPDDLARLDLTHLPAKRLECTSQHPLGSARMGDDPRNSVVDPDGRVWDVEGLWIADGAIVPTSLGVNPQVTVMAMALRVAQKMLEARRHG